jgi:hypothetical protein
VSTSLILVNFAGLATVAAGMLALCERMKSATGSASTALAPALVVRSGMLGENDQQAEGGRKGERPTVRRVSPLTERLTRSRDPIHKYREVTGRRARVRWWQRVRALVVLAAIVTALGVLVAVLVGIAFIGGTILLETVS